LLPKSENVKLSLHLITCCIIKAHGDVEAYLLTSLTSALLGGEWFVSFITTLPRGMNLIVHSADLESYCLSTAVCVVPLAVQVIWKKKCNFY
jgi:hypothetical protein